MKNQFDSILELIVYVFKNELFKLSIEPCYGEFDKSYHWENEKLKRIIYSDPNLMDIFDNIADFLLNENLIELFPKSILHPKLIEGSIGFYVESFYAEMHWDGEDEHVGRSGEADIKEVFNESLIGRLQKFDILKDINSNNIDKFLKFEYNTEEYFIEIFDQNKNQFENFESTEKGSEIAELISSEIINSKYSDEDRYVITENSIKFSTYEDFIFCEPYSRQIGFGIDNENIDLLDKPHKILFEHEPIENYRNYISDNPDWELEI